jgi:hypothetical protein
VKNTTLKAELLRLSQRAFHRGEWGAGLLRRIHRAKRRHKKHPDFYVLEKFYPWLFVPLTLWPVYLEGVGEHLVDQIEGGHRLDSATILLLSLLGEPPAPSTQEVVGQHEHHVQPADYSSLIHSQHKFDFREEELRGNPEFLAEWDALSSEFEISVFQDRKKIIRRRMLPERNYQQHRKFHWKTDEERFQTLFDTFCWRWHLYGMRGNEPLLMKLTVNLTPHGTMIFIPAYWSFDAKRDMKWKTITALHRARGVGKQGPKLSLGQVSQREDAEKAHALWQKATAAGLKGKQRDFKVMQEMGWPGTTDKSKLQRLIKVLSNSKRKKI